MSYVCHHSLDEQHIGPFLSQCLFKGRGTKIEQTQIGSVPLTKTQSLIDVTGLKHLTIL